MKSFVFLAVAAASFGMAVAAPQPKEDGAKADAVATGVVAQADALLGREPPPRKLDAIGKRLRSPIGENIATLADAYAATKDRKYLDGAVRYMRAAAAYSDWKPSYYLTCAGVMNGFSRALEVCGKDMDAEVRAELQDVLLDKGLKGSFLGWWWWAKSNWTQVCCYAVAYAALQIRDRHPRRAESYLRDAINGTKSAMEAYAPDGCYTEGPSYWHYATENTEKMIAVLRRCNGGDDGGISAMPGYEASKRWIADLRGPTGRIFGFADGSPVPDEPRAWGVTNVFVRVHRGIQPTGVLASPTMWVAVKGGRARVNHAHMDAGCFVLETVRGGRPVRWVEDLGTEKYSLMEKAGLDVWNTRQSSTRWRVFRQGVQAHAVLTVDGGDFDVGGNVTLAADGSDAIAADLTELCGEWKKATRRWRLTEGGLTLTDEIAGAKEGHSAVFNFLTRAKPEVEGRVLRLTCDGQTLEVTAGQDGAWMVEDVSRPRQKFDSPNPGVTRVAFTCPLRDGKLSFAFACGGCRSSRFAVSVGCVNCGQYDYGDGQTSAETYQANWNRLFAENPADIWFKEDTVASSDPNLCLEAVTANPPLSNTIVDLVAKCPEGKTERHYARRLVYRFGERTVAFYGMHLVAEGHVSKVKGSDGRTPSQRLRQLQFAGLIEDARQFDGAVLTGDFNAQQPWEYDIFKRAGYTCANCSERFGVTATLRDIPADNIIVSPWIEIETFKVVKDIKLSTDHFPLVARLKFGGGH